MDSYSSGTLTLSIYTDYAEGTTVSLFHTLKKYRSRTRPKDAPVARQSEDPRPRTRKALAAEHQKLGRRTIDGVDAEGIEIHDATTGYGANFKIDSVVSQFWSSVETGYPVLVEQTVVGNGGAVRIKTITDQFRWNVRFDPNEFKARIPPDYQLLDTQAGQRGFGGSGRGAGMRSSAPPKSGRKARK